MAQQVCVVLSAAEREQLAAIAADRNRPRKHVERARIVLASADRHSSQRVAHSTGVSRPTVWRWQQRFAESGVDGLLRDKTRKPGKPPIATETHSAGGGADLHRTTAPDVHWTGRAMAKATGISLGSVQRIWRAHNCSRTGYAPSNDRAIPASPPSSPTSSGFTSIRRPTRACCRLTKRARSRPSTAPNRDCRSSGPLSDHDPRLQTAWQHHPVRRLASSTEG
jgi:transposase